MRLKTSSALLSGRRDVIVVDIGKLLYIGAGNPNDYEESIIRLHRGQKIARNTLLHALVSCLYSRTTADFQRGNFRVKGDTVDIFLAYDDIALRVSFFDDEIEDLETIDPMTGQRIEVMENAAVFPAQLFVYPQKKGSIMPSIIYKMIMVKQVDYFRKHRKTARSQKAARAHRV